MNLIRPKGHNFWIEIISPILCFIGESIIFVPEEVQKTAFGAELYDEEKSVVELHGVEADTKKVDDVGVIVEPTQNLGGTTGRKCFNKKKYKNFVHGPLYRSLLIYRDDTSDHLKLWLYLR